MQSETKFDGAAKALLGVAAVLVLFNLVALILTAKVSATFLGMVNVGLALLAVYAAIGAVYALASTIRRGKPVRVPRERDFSR